MIIRNFYENQLAQASYLIGCPSAGEAIVVDPSRNIQQYIQTAKILGLKITAVTETHIHADYVSGSRELAHATGAMIYLSAEGGKDWQYQYLQEKNVAGLHDGDEIKIGEVVLQAIHTPGHTPEHLSFLLTDNSTSALPHSLFSGDFIFVGDVGRPDLLEVAAKIAGTRESSARQLFHSLKKTKDLPDYVLIWPGHGSGSACGKSLGGSPVTSLGYERATNWAFKVHNEAKFVDEILNGQPEPPNYFKDMKRINKEGPAVLGGALVPTHISEAVGQLIDIRDFDEIRKSSFQSSIAIPLCNSFTTWAGWMISYSEPITLIANNQEDADRAAMNLALIGLDDIAGWLQPCDLPKDGWSPISLIGSGEIDSNYFVLDVRSRKERNTYQIKGSEHIPFGELLSRASELPTKKPIAVHCESGGRSIIAFTILKKLGFENLVEIEGGISNVKAEKPELVMVGM